MPGTEIVGYRGPQIGDKVTIIDTDRTGFIMSFHPNRPGCVRVHPGVGNQAPWVVPLGDLMVMGSGSIETTDGEILTSRNNGNRWREALQAITPDRLNVGVNIDVLGVVRISFAEISWAIKNRDG